VSGFTARPLHALAKTFDVVHTLKSESNMKSKTPRRDATRRDGTRREAKRAAPVAQEDAVPPICVPDLNAIRDDATTLTKGRVAITCSPELRGKDRRHLRGLGHAIRPAIQIGHAGLTVALAERANESLHHHELIKVRMLETAPDDVVTAALWLHHALSAAPVQILGRTILLYRPHPSKPTIRLPK